MWTKGDRKARRELERCLDSDKDDHVTRFALVRLLAGKREWAVAEDLLRGPGVEQSLLADPTTRVAHLSSLGAAYLALWRARGHYYPSATRTHRDVIVGTPEYRLDISAERTELLHTAQGFLEEALAAAENLNDPMIRAQVAFCKEARGDCPGALSLYAGIIADSPLSPGTATVIFRTSALLSYISRFDECVRYLEYIKTDPPKGCSSLLLETLMYTCNVAIGLEMKVSKRLPALREAYNDEYTAGRVGSTFTREEIPWDRLPGWFFMWRELGEQCLLNGDYYCGVQMLSQALLVKEDAETLVCTGEMLHVIGDAKRALQHCERAYAADPSHTGAKRRLAGWAPDKWKERIIKEEDRRNAVAEIQRLAERSSRKADAMIARRRRRERARVFYAWRRVHHKKKFMVYRRVSAEAKDVKMYTEGGESGTASGPKAAGKTGRAGPDGQLLDDSGGSLSTSVSLDSGSESSSDSNSPAGDSSSSATLTISTLSSDSTTAVDEKTGRTVSVPRWTVRPAAPSRSSPHVSPKLEKEVSFPTPSAFAAQQAGRSNLAAFLRAAIGSVKKNVVDGRDKQKEAGEESTVGVAPVIVAATMIREAMVGGGRAGKSGWYRTPEMKALARFEWERRGHEAKNTQAVFGS